MSLEVAPLAPRLAVDPDRMNDFAPKPPEEMSDDELLAAYEAEKKKADLTDLSDEDLLAQYKAEKAKQDPYNASEVEAPEPSWIEKGISKVADFAWNNPATILAAPTLEVLRPRESRVSKEGIDTATGGPFMLRTLLARASNPEEAELTLRKYFKEGEYGQDRQGRWWVLQPGKKKGSFRKVLIEPEGSFATFLSGLGAGAAAEGTPMAASAAGAAAGTLGGPFAPFTIPAGAGLGWMAGKGIDELAKYFGGTYAKTPDELGKEILKGGIINTAIPAAASVIPKIGPAFKRLVADVTPATANMNAELLAEGARPPIGSAAPGMKGFESKRQASVGVSGDQAADINHAWVERQVVEHMAPLGIDEAAAKDIAYELARKAQAVSSETAADSIVAAAQRRHTQLQTVIDDSLQAAQQRLQGLERSMRTYAQPDPNVAEAIGRKMVADRQEFGQYFDQAYNAVHQQAGGAAFIPVGPARTAALQIMRVEPEAAIPNFVREISELHGNMTLEQAQAFRNFARARERQLSGGGNLTPGVQYHYYSTLEEAIDDQISNVARTGQGLAPDAARSLRDVDALYREGIQDFKNLTMRQLAKDVEDGLVVNPGAVADKILRPENAQTARMVWRRLTPEMQDNVRRADLNNLITHSSVQDPVTGRFVLDGTALVKNLELRRDIMGVAHTPSFMAQLREFANTYKTVNGKLDPAALTARGGAGSGRASNPSMMVTTMRRWQDAQKKMQEFASENPLAAFRNGTAEERDAAAAFLIKPGQQARMRDVMASLTAPERLEVHRYVMQKLFDEALELNPARQLTISGNKVREFLGRYSPEQQNVILPHGMADSLRRLGDKINFLFPSESGDWGGNLAVKAVLNRNFFNPLALSKRVGWYTSAWFTNRPAVLRWFADIAQKDPKAAETAMSATGRYLYNTAMTGPGRDKPKPVME